MSPDQMAKLCINTSVYEVQSLNGPLRIKRWYVVSLTDRFMYLSDKPFQQGKIGQKGLPVPLDKSNFYERTPLEAAAAKALRAEARIDELKAEMDREMGKARAYYKECNAFLDDIKDNAGNMEVDNAAR